jgi:hypothetical protein
VKNRTELRAECEWGRKQTDRKGKRGGESKKTVAKGSGKGRKRRNDGRRKRTQQRQKGGEGSFKFL